MYSKAIEFTQNNYISIIYLAHFIILLCINLCIPDIEELFLDELITGVNPMKTVMQIKGFDEEEK